MTLDPNKWYFKTYAFIIAFLCIGPFALPLAWINPRYNLNKKIFITLITLVISYFMFVTLAKSTATIYSYYDKVLKGG